LFFWVVRVLRRRPSDIVRNILIVRVDHIGDVVMATAPLTALRKAFPASRIDFMAPSWAREILEEDPRIDNVIIFDPPWFMRTKTAFLSGLKGFFAMVGMIRKGEYGVVVDLRGDARHILAAFFSGVKCRISYGITGLGFLLTDQVLYKELSHEIDRDMALLGPLGVKCEHAQVRAYFSRENILEAENIRKEEGIDRPYAVLHMFAGRKEKNWTPEGFVGVIDFLAAEKKLLTVIIGSETDHLYIKDVTEKISHKAINLSGKVSLGALGPFLEKATLFIGLDSGPSHMAAATGTPCVILFSGVNDPAQWAPRGENVRVIYPGEGKGLSQMRAKDVMAVVDEVLGAKR